MSGHSKWATIKHQKGAQDIKRGKVFTKIGRTIALAAREGGRNAETNFKLRLAIEKARQVNMPQNTIEKAIRRGTGEDAAGKIEEVIYEAIGPAGLSLMIKAATDNKNRTLAEIKHILAQHHVKFAESGSLAWQFEAKGILVLADQKLSEDQELGAIEAGAEDIKTIGGKIHIYTSPANLQMVKEGLEQAQLSVDSVELGFVPKNTVKIDFQRIEALLSALDDHDDVQEIYTNLEI